MAVTNTPQRQFGGLLGNVPGNLLTVPNDGSVNRYVMAVIVIANTDAADHTVTLFHLPSGGADDGAHTILPGVTIKANSMISIGRGMDMEPGDLLDGVADTAGKVSVTIYYIKQTP